ncbi:MAG: hypothetical protein K2M98_05120, partial [Muribaculum sp.]|nr:hypothetical protein [Muribaculum sp.]
NTQGQHIAESVDYAIIVGKYNREAILDGINDKGILPNEKIFTPDTFNQAQGLLSQIAKRGDTVLYENDLPDTFK